MPRKQLLGGLQKAFAKAPTSRKAPGALYFCREAKRLRKADFTSSEVAP